MNTEKIINEITSIINSFNQWRLNKEEYNYLMHLLKGVKRKQLLKKTIVFNTVKGERNYIDREFFLGKILAINGAKIIMLLDDGVLKHWESPPQSYFKKYLNHLVFFLRENIIKRALKTYHDPNLQIIYYSEFLFDLNYENWQELKHFALSSTIRHFQTSELDFNNKKIKKYYNLSLKNAVLSRNVGEFVLNKIKPDFFITSHGIYSTWGPAYEFLKQHGIKSLVCARSHSHSMDVQDIYFTYAKAQTLSRCKLWQDYKNTSITEAMRKKVEELFDFRINHKTKDTKLYYKGKINLYKIDKNDGYKYHIAIFPSLIWDGNIIDRHIAFKGVLDWLLSTIHYFKNKRDAKIYLKFHPAEVSTFNKSAKIQDLIQNYLKSKKIKNLVLIPTEYKIDPYEFLKSGIDFGICYDGMLALEMPYLKIPVLLGGVRGRFCVDGGNFTINNKKDYYNYLDNLDKCIKDFHTNYDQYYNNIIRYSYWYLFENVLKMPTVLKTNRGFIDLFQLRKKDLELDKKLFKIFN